MTTLCGVYSSVGKHWVRGTQWRPYMRMLLSWEALDFRKTVTTLWGVCSSVGKHWVRGTQWRPCMAYAPLLGSTELEGHSDDNVGHMLHGWEAVGWRDTATTPWCVCSTVGKHCVRGTQRRLLDNNCCNWKFELTYSRHCILFQVYQCKLEDIVSHWCIKEEFCWNKMFSSQILNFKLL